MALDPSSLMQLEYLLNEFYDYRTSATKLQQIENILQQFSQQAGAWEVCLHFLTSSQNNFALMFSLKVLEYTIAKKWIVLSGTDKSKIRQTLGNIYANISNPEVIFVRNKLAKLLVDIARIDWPHFYPEFFNNIIELCKNPSSISLGLVLLHTASEDLAVSSSNTLSSRKKELQDLLLRYVPTVFTLFNELIEVISESHRETVTPPPSPTYGKDTDFNSQKVFINDVFDKLPKGKSCDVEAYKIAGQVLTCINNFFLWVPVNVLETSNFILSIFHIASLPLLTKNNAKLELKINVAKLALDCIMEVWSRPNLGLQLERLLLAETLKLLIQLNGSLNPHIKVIDKDYIVKMTECLRLVVQNHFARIEGDLAVSTFLEAFDKYTFNQMDIEGYIQCLDAWIYILDYLTNIKNHSDSQGKYGCFFQHYMTEIFNKLLFKHYPFFLEDIIKDTSPDSMDSMWGSLLSHSLKTFSKIVEFIPKESLEYVVQEFKDQCNKINDLHTRINENYEFTIEGEEALQLRNSLHDLAVILQALGHMPNHCIGENFETFFPLVNPAFSQVLELGDYILRGKFSHSQLKMTFPLKKYFIQVHVQVLQTLHSFVCWLAKFEVVLQQNGTLFAYLGKMIESSLSVIMSEFDNQLIFAAAHLARSLSVMIQSADKDEAILQLGTPISNSQFLLSPIETQCAIYRAVANASIAKGLRDSSSQAYYHLVTFFSPSIPVNSEEYRSHVSISSPLKWSIYCLKDQVDNLEDSNGPKKKYAILRLQPVIEYFTKVFEQNHMYAGFTNEILPFFLSVFKVLRVQLGSRNIENIINTFQQTLTWNQLHTFLVSNGHNIVEMFLLILQQVACERSFKHYLPNILLLSVKMLYPKIVETSSLDLKHALFDLYRAILNQHWFSFFKASLPIETTQNDQQLKESESFFTEIMQSFLQSFSDPNISIVKQVLGILEQLNDKWKLYQKPIFTQMMKKEFMAVFINNLYDKSHMSLKEDIEQALYNMASCDFHSFFDVFLPHYVRAQDNLDDNQKYTVIHSFKPDTDYKSFSDNLQKFLNNLQYYRVCNSSLNLTI